ncbi:hypothetical protein C3B55_00549 [Candidatus Pseudomonas adelgestsugas]|uniref:Uncharacterized protein n=1 Tax=Candidatus Pseudomonas adelgestsugas TaxID=1302376 RepID=A0ABX5R9B3_9PSED|nr:hypothetical protein C3B55_00549 [Candidatus Pseudomonas adelgestsugas]
MSQSHVLYSCDNLCIMWYAVLTFHNLVIQKPINYLMFTSNYNFGKTLPCILMIMLSTNEAIISIIK